MKRTMLVAAAMLTMFATLPVSAQSANSGVTAAQPNGADTVPASPAVLRSNGKKAGSGSGDTSGGPTL